MPHGGDYGMGVLMSQPGGGQLTPKIVWIFYGFHQDIRF